MNAGQLKAALSSQRDLIASALAPVSAAVREMHIPADQTWTALVVSIRLDLVH